jgi:hypothetical protein
MTEQPDVVAKPRSPILMNVPSSLQAKLTL